MFLRIGIENHRSIWRAVELSFIATRLQDNAHEPFRPAGSKREAPHGVLPALALLGGNASGKSNLLAAVRDFSQHITTSFLRHEPTGPVPRAPFKLDPALRAAPTRMDCDVLVGGVRYHYGFTCTDEAFTDEWLYAWPEGTRQLWFHRQGPRAEEGYFGPGLKGERRSVARLTRPNALFLSTAAQLNHEQLTPLHAALTAGVEVGMADAHQASLFSRSPLFKPEHRARVQALLGAADLGVVDFRLENRRPLFDEAITRIDQAAGPENPLSQALRKQLQDNGDPFALLLAHQSAGPTPAWLEPEEESEGTRTLLTRLHEALGMLERGGLWVVDELDRSLHPRLVAELVALFTDPEVNRRGAQLLFNTHATELLDALRRDEVVLVDKGPEGATRVARMSDYKVLKREDLTRTYAQGRVGGLPRLGALRGALQGLVSGEEDSPAQDAVGG